MLKIAHVWELEKLAGDRRKPLLASGMLSAMAEKRKWKFKKENGKRSKNDCGLAYNKDK